MLPSEAMVKASEIIEEYGWSQAMLGSKLDGFCLDGAVATAHGWPDEFDGYAYDRTRSVLVQFVRTKFQGGPILFNDHPGRTKEEVLEMLRWAAAEAAKTEEAA